LNNGVTLAEVEFQVVSFYSWITGEGMIASTKGDEDLLALE
jgi:hypothetical protein